jgi:hypothetical protein
MVFYECNLCNFSSKIKTHHFRHLNTKKHLNNYEKSLCLMVSVKKDPKKTQKRPGKDPKRPKKTQKEQVFFCVFCASKFSSYAHKRRHEIHRCKNNGVKNIIHDEKDKIIIKLEKRIDTLIEKTGNTTINNNIQTNIQLNSYGNENLSHITDTLKKSFLKIPYGMIPKMVEAIHFNDNFPENKNIILPNKRDNKIKIFRNNKWVYKKKEEVLNDLIDGKYFIMDNFYENNIDMLAKPNIDNYTKFKEIFKTLDKDMLDNIRKDCEIIMLNNR